LKAEVKAKYEQGLSDEEVAAEMGKGFVSMEMGTIESIKRICTGQVGKRSLFILY
jgi:hypothetical protein